MKLPVRVCAGLFLLASYGVASSMPVWRDELALEYPVAEWTFTSTNGTGVAASNLLTLVAIAGPAEAFSGTLTATHTNGMRCLAVQVDRGKLTGTCQFWHPNGALARLGWLESDIPVGDWVWWDSNQRAIGKNSYTRSGVRTGTWVVWDAETSFALLLRSFTDGKVEGPVFWFREQGELREQERYSRGKRASVTNAAALRK